jgi:hypothetical protein
LTQEKKYKQGDEDKLLEKIKLKEETQECGVEKKSQKEREREMGLEAYMQWVEFGRNWRDPAPAAGIVVKLWKGRACEWLLLLLLLL